MRTLKSLVAATVLVGASFIVAVPHAQASVTVAPSTSTGTATAAFAITTSGPCASETASTKLQVFLTGSGFPAGGYPITDKRAANTVQSGAGYSMPLLYTMSDAASRQDPPATLSGLYTFTVRCYEGIAATPTETLGTADIFFIGSDWSIPLESSTALTASPLITTDGDVTLTATVTPSDAAGSMEFFATPSGGDQVSLGTVPVASGVASTTETLAGGASAGVYASYSITAVFTPSSAHAGSTSPVRTVYVLSDTPASSETVTFLPARGTSSSAVDVYSSVVCPNQTASTKFQVKVTGAGFPSAGYNVTGLEPATGRLFGDGLKSALQKSMLDLAAEQNPPATLTGRYDFTWTCFDQFASRPTAVIGVGSMWFTTATAYQTTDPALDSIDTTLSTAISPVGSVVSGQTVTFTATVSPSTATGSVAFTATPSVGDAVNLGTATVVDGVATLTYSTLPGGSGSGLPRSYSISAEYTPATSAYRSSSAEPRTLVVLAKLTPVNTVAPSITGAKVGSVLVCRVGTWTDATSYTAVVRIGGTAVTAPVTTSGGVTAARYTVRPADANKTVTCSITGRSVDSVSVAASAATTPRVALGNAARATRNPVINGRAAVRSTLSVTTGTWTPAGARFSYQWVTFDARNRAVPIARATGARFTITAAQKGKVVGVVVTATVTGYQPGSVTVRSTKVP